jgi:hypothetical protein
VFHIPFRAHPLRGGAGERHTAAIHADGHNGLGLDPILLAQGLRFGILRCGYADHRCTTRPPTGWAPTSGCRSSIG